MGDFTEFPVPGAERSARRGVPAPALAVVALAAWAMLSFLLAAVAARTAFDVAYIPSPAMSRTLDVGDRVVVDRTAYLRGSPRHGDIVQLARGDLDVIKRVIAVGGDTISCCDASGRVQVNGASLDEPYLFEDDKATFGPVAVPDGQAFVMGDHRSRSSDSRNLGPVPEDDLRGRVLGLRGGGIMIPPLALGAVAAAILLAVPLAVAWRRRAPA